MRFASLCGLGAALVCAAFLVACGGGGGSGPTAGSSLTGGSLNGSHAASNQGPGTHVTVVINRAHTTHPLSKAKRGAKTVRNPKYIDGSNAEGLQFTVSATGAASQTVYADISSSSPLCTTSGPIETCVVTVPTIASNEQMTALEVDSLPSSENSAGYGTGFPTGSDILGAVAQSETVQLGAPNAFGVELGMVSASFYDCTPYYYAPSPLPQPFSTNFGIDDTGVDDAGFGYFTAARVVVTAGVATTGSITPAFSDIDGCYCDFETTPAPFVDVNASPVPITFTSNTQNLTMAPIVNNGTPPPSNGYAQTVSVPNDSYNWPGYYFFVGVETTAALSSPATITMNNNLTAPNPFGTFSYAATMVYTVVPISVSPTTAAVSAAGGTATVTGSDYGAANGMDAESSYTANSGIGTAGDENCKTTGGTTLATVAPGSMNTTNWTQPFTITGASNGTGTCTFYVFDYEALTITQAVTVTVN